MENFRFVDIRFDDSELSSLVIRLNQCFVSCQNNFVDLCVSIHHIWKYCKGNYFRARDNEMYNSYKLLEKFGFDKQAVNRYKRCFERYIDCSAKSDGDFNYYLFNCYKMFSPSKLFEMLALSTDTLVEVLKNKAITPEMTVKQIRDYIKSIKDGTDKAEKVLESKQDFNEDEIPMAFDPKDKYEYSYFESKSKNQLLNIVWELYEKYQKLLNKEKKIKNGK